MITQDIARDLIGAPARDTHGQELGRIDAVFVDDQNAKPEFAAVSMPETGSALVPLIRAEQDGDGVRVAFTREQVAAAPSVAGGDGLSQDEEARLYSHYGLDYSVTIVDEDTIRVHRRANEQDLTGDVEEHHEVFVERAPLDDEDI